MSRLKPLFSELASSGPDHLLPRYLTTKFKPILHKCDEVFTSMPIDYKGLAGSSKAVLNELFEYKCFPT